MNRKTLTALAVLGLLIVVAVVVLRQPEKGQTVGERPRPVPKLAAGTFDTLSVTKANATTTVKKDGGKYKIVAPGNYVADETAAKQAFEAVEKLEFGNVVSDQKAKHAEFEVDDKALKLVVKKGDQVQAELLIGKSVGGNTLVRLPGKDEVWQGLGSFRYNFDRDTNAWRDKTIVKLTPADVEKIEVKSKDGGRTVVKANGPDKWSVVESTVPVDKLDNTVPAGIVSTLSSWVTNDFADNAKPEQTGLAAPQNTITVSLKGGKTVVASIGNKHDADTYVKLADNPQVYLVKRYNLDRLDRHPIDFRDKTICDISDAELGEVTVTHGKDSFALVREKAGKAAGKKGDKKSDTKGDTMKADDKADWRAVKPAGLTVDPSKVTTLASAFKDWKATGFAEDQSPKSNGLAKPAAVIVAHSKDKTKTCTVKVGDENKDKTNYFAQAGTRPDVYLVAKWATDRILPKVDDLKKK